ncbi:MAG TPA: hypothetical protein VGO22_18240, partial [Pseudorhizobium sp.]|nr:hypothetical protein [Pseudorhizobium sp.]
MWQIDLHHRIPVGLVLLLTVFLLGAPSPSYSYSLPQDPISPTNMQQCRELYARFQAVGDQVRSEAKAKYREADAMPIEMMPGLAWRKKMAEGHNLMDAAFEIAMEGGRARSRCEQQVRAHQTSQQRNSANTQNTVQQLPVSMGSMTAKAGLKNYLTYLKEHGSSTDQKAAGLAFGRIWITLDKVNNVTGRNGLAGYAALGIDAASSNPLQRFLTKAAVSTFMNIHSSAWADFQSAVDEFNGTRSNAIASLFRSAEARRTALLNGSGASISENFLNQNKMFNELSSDWSKAIEETSKASAARRDNAIPPKTVRSTSKT